MDETANPDRAPKSEQSPLNWEVSLLGERFRLKPSAQGKVGGDTSESELLAQEAVAWVGRQLAAAEARMVGSVHSKPKAHHVALLALVELAHEAMMDRNRHAQALDGLIAKLESLKAKRQGQSGEVVADETPSIPLDVIAQAEEAWLRDEQVGSTGPAAHS